MLLKHIKTIEEIKSVLLKDDLYIGVLNNNFDNINLHNTLWFICSDQDNDVGVIAFQEFADNCLSVHGGVYKLFREYSNKYFKDAMDIIRKELNCTFITTIHSNNKKALEFAKRNGFKYKTKIKNACKDGDIIILAEK